MRTIETRVTWAYTRVGLYVAVYGMYRYQIFNFGVYDVVANFNIGMKLSILIYEKLNIIPGVFTLKDCKDINSKTYSIF